jgi:hypothetical protein
MDALSCAGLTVVAVQGDVNCDGRKNSVDAALMLQYDSGLIESFSCPDDADMNGDGAVNALDAAVLLMLEAGLIDRATVA